MAIKTQFKNFGKKKEGGSGSGGGNVYAGGSTQIFGNTNTYDLTATNGIIYNLKGDKLDYNDGNFDNLVATNGNISNLTGYTLNFNTADIDNIMSDIIHANNVGTEDKPINEIYAHKANIDQILSTNITTDYLTVTKSAHFFELIIDKIKSVGGSIILSATNCTLDYVEPTTITVNNLTCDAYEVWWKAKGPDGRETSNDWWKYDQAICQSFNNVTQGVNNNVDSKYYWRLVMDVSENNTPRPNPYYMWLGDENDPRNGTRIQTQGEINYNSLYIYDVTAIMQTNFVGSLYDGQEYDSYAWNVTAHGGNWHSDNVNNHPSRGTYKTTSTTDYLELTPGWNQNVSGDTGAIVPNILRIQLGRRTPCCFADWARLNVFVEYADGTSFCQPAKSIAYLPDSDVSVGTSCSPNAIMITLNTDTEIKRVCIFNADPVQWQKVHHITLGNDNRNDQGNTYPQYDANSSYGYSSVPAPGDSLVHLGYRYFIEEDIAHAWRASAIMIAAYKTPDPDLTPPSYAHYKDITSFNLRSKRHTYFDATKAHFVGDFYVDANKTIQMNVFDTINNRTGIDIEQGTITLDAANTYINGNLTLTSDDQGFLVRGPQGMAIMTPNTIGSLYDFLGETNNIAEVGGHDVKTPNSSSDTTFEQFYILGNLEANKSITISDFESEFVWNDTLASAQMLGSTSTVTFQLKKGNTIIDSDDITGLSQGGTICTLNTGANSGTFTLNVQISTRPATHRNAQMTANWKYYVTIPISGTYTKIGTDGIAIKFDNNKYAYFGNDETQIVYEANGTRSGISVTGAGHVQQLAPDGQTWVPIGMPKVTEITTTGQQYTANYRGDEFYIATGNFGNTDVVINLPISGIPEGKKVYVKNAQNGSATLNCTSVSGSSGRIIKSDKNLGNGITQMVEVDAYPRMFIYTGTYWCEFYCG